MAEELVLTEEEQSYMDMGRAEGPTIEPEEKPVEEPKTEDTPAKEEEKPAEEPVKDEDVKADDGEGEPDPEEKKEEPRPPRRTKDDTIKALRADRRELREQVKQNKEFQQKAQERLDTIASKMEERSDPAPDPDMEPDAHREYQDRKIQDYETREVEQKKITTEQVKEDNELQELQSFVADQEADFAEEHEDYMDALEWGKEEWARREADKWKTDIETARKQTFNDIRELAIQARARGGNVAAILYQQALAMGYGKTEGTQEKTNQPKTDDLKTIAAGQKAAKNPRGGATTKGGLTVEEFAAMDDEDFHKIASDNNALKKLFGG